MMLRPATPLSVLLFVAFALLLLSTLSTPIIKAIPLATFQNVNFGVFGYCKGDQCSGFTIGYSTDSVFSTSSNSDFSLPSSNRHSLSSILIIHPIAAFLTLICFILAVAAHFHSPAHSPRYLLGLLLLTFPTLLVSLLAFLVDILLFVPHMAWGGWIVLAATIVITASGIVTCAMRRTLVSRKARRKRIAENAEMNGENLMYNKNPDSLARAESPPPLSGNTVVGNPDKMPEFATFELQQKKSSDDRTPLNPRNPSTRSGNSTTAVDTSPSGMYGDQGRIPGMGLGRGRGPPRDEYGNPIPPPGPNNGYGPPPPNMRGGPMMRGRGGPPPFRGRGGYPPRGGPMRGRGGYPPRGGYRGGPQGMRGPPPPGWNGNGGGMGPTAAAGVMGAGVVMGRGQQGPPPGYDNRYYGNSRDPSPSPYNQPRDDSPAPPMPAMDGNAPIGQAAEMDNGVVSPQNSNQYGLRDSDSDLEGMMALQQGGFNNGPPAPRRQDSTGPLSPTSVYSTDAYIPPRQNWANAPPLPTHQANHATSETAENSRDRKNSRGLSPIQASPTEPVEMDAAPVNFSKPMSPMYPPTPTSGSPPVSTGHKHTNSSDNYYEDVDPRFAEPTPAPEPMEDVSDRQVAPSGIPSSGVLPSALVPGYPQDARASPIHKNTSNPNLPHPNGSNPPLQPSPSQEDINEGARSPTTSETSHFTSVSQRGVNPNWRPGPGPPPPGAFPPYGAPPRRGPRQEDVVLQANPDFALPGIGPPRTRGRGGISQQAMMRGALQRGGTSTLPSGRYPNAI